MTEYTPPRPVTPLMDIAASDLLALPEMKGLTPKAAALDFAAAMLEGAKSERLDMTPAAFGALLSEIFKASAVRMRGETLITSVAVSALPAECSAFAVVTDDKPFLVASITGELAAQATTMDALIHPILSPARDKSGKRARKGEGKTESYMVIVTPRLTPQAAKRAKTGLTETLGDVSKVVADFVPMRAALHAAEQDLARLDNLKNGEAREFLRWLYNGNFVLMGARRFDYTHILTDEAGNTEPDIISESNLGLLRDENLQVLRNASEPTQVTKSGVILTEYDPVVIAKSNLASRVHRRVRLDYISVKHYADDGEVVGETRFIGLFTAAAYNLPPDQVPLLREKLANVRARAQVLPGSHNAKSLDYVLATYPRDELFQIREDDLLRISIGIVSVLDRPRSKLFIRRDPFDRFISALVFVPREQYNTILRRRIGQVLKDAYGGRVSAFYPRYADEPVARVHFIIGVTPYNHPEPDVETLERMIAQIAQPWEQRLLELSETRPDVLDPKITARFASGFRSNYQDNFSIDVALTDLVEINKLGTIPGAMRIRAYRRNGDDPRILRAKFYRYELRLEPSGVMPIFDHLGLYIVQETGYEILSGERRIWIHDFEIRLPEGAETADGTLFEDGVLAVLSGHTDNDRFNALIMRLGLSWRDVAVIRTMCRYRAQSGMDPSETVQIAALTAHGDIARLLFALFETRFDPKMFADMGARAEAATAIVAKITSALDTVQSLDYDRVLRRLSDLLQNTLRTNFYQRDDDGAPSPYISLKIASRELEDLPNPKPYREIFVWSPRVEGLHLRFGPVARGGLRWSDRRDDYRTEVLGLVKAQQVKNAVIVPVGSKGGFYPKDLPIGGDRNAIMEEGIAAYTIFISGLLDITDNYVGTDIVPPQDVLCWDASDPYLVVAADKGTATFSDIANGIAMDKGFWLADAFASGGSVGYDHKKMGITARGGWEAVKRHFREMGKDIQNEDFTVIGVGDMSGDVFGNGMLLSPHIQLLAAFNHLDIFIDPTPDAQSSFAERARLFALPRSTWQDYNAELISKGGGVFSRAEKSIALTPQIKALTGLSRNEVTPNELIHALLKTQCELLWFGGIGTYIRSSLESDLQVGDKANDPVRVTGCDVSAKVVGEGANLGVTQAGRIEFARSGGRINTDAIDNSAGVDSSDHEVNIKILLGGAIEQGALKKADRNALLESMTDDVARLVLAHNYDQTGALSRAQLTAVNDHNAYERFMSLLERGGRLDRIVEGLPSTAEMRAREAEDRGLYRPELAVLLAYAKIKLFDDLMASGLTSDPYLHKLLQDYFPPALSKFDKAMETHRLRGEIIGSRLANLIVDVGGPLFMMRAAEHTNGIVSDISSAFIIAYAALDGPNLRREIAALDNVVSASAQYDVLAELARVISRITGWIVRRYESGEIEPRLTPRKNALADLDSDWLNLLSSYDRKRAQGRVSRFTKQGIPQELAERAALLRSYASGFDVVAFASETGWDLKPAAELFYDIGGRFKIDRLRNAAIRLTPKDHWDRLALRRITEDFYAVQGQLALLAARAHKTRGGKANVPARNVIDPWLKDHLASVKAYDSAYMRLSGAGGWTLAKFALAVAQLQELSVG
ncbi:NAD-glutamate dehydrogenase [Robiginitomaculum antarcticum]|uniref:NAD-glutamate dehydrogenase n=1 Tax=Robiginitomaculum antarcticum TaxID=437507 RepID=UPI00037AE1F3|nr:NAD-glutamate dehydrogenase [Robiginitomaculum antarcticum]